MNDSLDLRNRILKMRETNNLTVTRKEALNNNLMSKFESSIKEENQKKTTSDKDTIDDKNNEKILKSHKNNSEGLSYNNDKYKSKNTSSIVNSNEAQFLMLANKFNEAVEVILELSHKVDKLEKNVNESLSNSKINNNQSSFFNFKIFVFFILFTAIVLGLFTLPIDFSFIKLIISDIISNL